MRADIIQEFSSRFDEYAKDESKLCGYAHSISFPENAEEIAEVIRHVGAAPGGLTIQGGRSGICGGAVPFGGHILNLSRCKRITALRANEGGYTVTAQAGVTLSELAQCLEERRFDTAGWDAASIESLERLRKSRTQFWPPESTETSATIGGVIVTGARGIAALHYGNTRRYVGGMTVVTADGACTDLRRGQRWPDADSEGIDIMIGSEGIFGVVADATLRLVERPAEIWGICFFLADVSALHTLADYLKAMERTQGSAAMVALEYMDAVTLRHIAQHKKVASKLKALPDISEQACGMLYVELHGALEEDIEGIAAQMLDLAAACGCEEEMTWALSGFDEVSMLRALRHAAPESINIALEKYVRQDARITKLSMDIAWANRRLDDVIAMYRAGAEAIGVEIALFGHALDNRIHANLLAKDSAQYKAAKALVAQWTADAARAGESLRCENGVGKLKRHLLRAAGMQEQQRLRCLKEAVDPAWVLNPGDVIERP